MFMYIYLSKKRDYLGNLTPIVIESNLEWAVPYWTKQKQTNPTMFWEIK